MPDDFWPEEIGVQTISTPVQLLREQAAALSRRTGNLLEGRVETSGDYAGDLRHDFVVVVPALDGYRYTLFSVTHGPELYPAKCKFESPLPVKVDSEPEFVNWLKGVLGSEKTRKVIAGLLGQVKS